MRKALLILTMFMAAAVVFGEAAEKAAGKDQKSLLEGF